jgi:hypothetical protein
MALPNDPLTWLQDGEDVEGGVAGGSTGVSNRPLVELLANDVYLDNLVGGAIPTAFSVYGGDSSDGPRTDSANVLWDWVTTPTFQFTNWTIDPGFLVELTSTYGAYVIGVSDTFTMGAGAGIDLNGRAPGLGKGNGGGTAYPPGPATQLGAAGIAGANIGPLNANFTSATGGGGGGAAISTVGFYGGRSGLVSWYYASGGIQGNPTGQTGAAGYDALIGQTLSGPPTAQWWRDIAQLSAASPGGSGAASPFPTDWSGRGGYAAGLLYVECVNLNLAASAFINAKGENGASAVNPSGASGPGGGGAGGSGTVLIRYQNLISTTTLVDVSSNFGGAGGTNGVSYWAGFGGAGGVGRWAIVNF